MPAEAGQIFFSTTALEPEAQGPQGTQAEGPDQEKVGTQLSHMGWPPQAVVNRDSGSVMQTADQTAMGTEARTPGCDQAS